VNTSVQNGIRRRQRQIREYELLKNHLLEVEEERLWIQLDGLRIT